MNIKRQRGRGRNKPANNNPNRAYESTGPDMKVRGSAQTILEKYQQAGRDAMASGDRILAENYMQHAEHYLRLLKSIQPHFVPRSELAIAGLPADSEEENSNNDASENENDIPEDGTEETEMREPRNNWRDNRGERGERNDRGDRIDRGERNDRYNNNRRRNNNTRDRYNNRRRDNQQDSDEATYANASTSENMPNDGYQAENNYASDAQRDDNVNINQERDFVAKTNPEVNPDANYDNQENAVTENGVTPESASDGEKPTRGRRTGSRLRSPLGRRPRTRREDSNSDSSKPEPSKSESRQETTGFGEELPAFLAQAPTNADV